MPIFIFESDPRSSVVDSDFLVTAARVVLAGWIDVVAGVEPVVVVFGEVVVVVSVESEDLALATVDVVATIVPTGADVVVDRRVAVVVGTATRRPANGPVISYVIPPRWPGSPSPQSIAGTVSRTGRFPGPR
jgi:hypothetical protein